MANMIQNLLNLSLSWVKFMKIREIYVCFWSKWPKISMTLFQILSCMSSPYVSKTLITLHGWHKWGEGGDICNVRNYDFENIKY